jgi:hypothetical protein
VGAWYVGGVRVGVSLFFVSFRPFSWMKKIAILKNKSKYAKIRQKRARSSKHDNNNKTQL